MQKVSKSQLRKRWTETGSPHQRVREDIFGLIQEPGLATIRALIPDVDGRVDLRGLDFTPLVKAHTPLRNHFEKVDFSYSTLCQWLNFERSAFIDCLFNHTQIDCGFWGSRFDGCVFAGTVIHSPLGNAEERTVFQVARSAVDQPSPTGSKKPPMSYAGIGLYDYERFHHCQFRRAKFKKYSHFGAINIDCVFEHCDIRSGWIYGAFENCTFIGKLYDNIFHGHRRMGQQGPHSSSGLFNTMRGVDFSQCEMTFIAFHDGCDVSRISPPDAATHCIYPTTMAFARMVEVVGEEFGMRVRYPQGQYPSFVGSLSSLYRTCGADLEFMVGIDPSNEQTYRNDELFEQRVQGILYGLITPRDYGKSGEAYQQALFEVFVEAVRRLAT
jgi:hypothetical protein